jgi:hypothetical protein
MDNRNESVKIISDWLKLKPQVAAASYDIYAQVLSSDGVVSDQALKVEVDRAVKTFKIADEVRLNSLVDFSILDLASKEMKLPTKPR